jgi:UDP-N-acetylmuramoylalanine--D-glutamate ligase
MTGKRVVAMGLGRSGLAVARAALAHGANPVVVDEKLELLKPELVDQARSEGIEVRLGWSGTFAELSPDFVVVNPAVDARHPKLTESGIEFIGEVEFAYRIARGPIVAITGTNGKSTTTVMTYLALQACGVDPLLCGNIFGSGYPELPMTEAALHGRPGQPLVAEISSFGLEWAPTFRPRCAAITNIRPDHLDRYDSFEAYAATKMRIFANQREEDFAVVRAHDPVVVPPCGTSSDYVPRHRRSTTSRESVSGTGECPTVLTFGATGEHARVDEMDLSILDTRISLESLPWSEPHNHANAACAALLAYGLLEVTVSPLIAEALAAKPKPSVYSSRREPQLALPPLIVEGLRQFKGLSHRMERVGVRDGVTIVNNSMCTNPDAVVSSAQALRDPALLLIGGVNKGLSFGSLGRLLGGGRHRAFLFGRDADQINAEMGGRFPIFATMLEAFSAAVRSAHQGEVVMLAPGCASSDQFRDFRHRGDEFRAMAQEWLAG